MEDGSPLNYGGIFSVIERDGYSYNIFPILLKEKFNT